MANYTENFTSVNGDTVDASELETEFDAIATAIATKVDVYDSITAKTTIADADVFSMYDTSGTAYKQITGANIKTNANWFKDTGFHAVRSTNVDPATDNAWVRFAPTYTTETYDYGTLFDISNGKYTPGSSHNSGIFYFYGRAVFTDSGGAGLNDGVYVGVAVSRYNSSDVLQARKYVIVSLGSAIIPAVSISTEHSSFAATDYVSIETYCSETDHLVSRVDFSGGRVT